MKKTVALFAIVCCAMCASATQYSKLSIITAAKALDRWDGIKAWIAASGFQDEWNAASYLSDEYPQYPAITNAVVQSGVCPAEDLLRIMAASTDTAVPDNMLAFVVSNDCLTASGRVKWHGKVVTNHIDTAALTRTQVFADGWTFVEKFKSVNALPLEKQLSQAELKQRRESAAKARAEAEAKKKADRIADLQTNMVALATALARQKQYPYQLAEMLLQNELNKALGTNTVDAVITPQ